MLDYTISATQDSAYNISRDKSFFLTECYLVMTDATKHDRDVTFQLRGLGAYIV